jgi:hypothetical protein
MTRVLIPRSDNSSAKIIEASDWEKYFANILRDYVKTGFTITAQCPNVLAVNVSSGEARLKGLYIENTTQCSVTCLTACSTNYIYATICRDPSCEPQGWVFSKNTTGTTPACSMILGSATTNGSTVTSINQKLEDAICGGGLTGLFNTANPDGEWLLGSGVDGDVTITGNTTITEIKYYNNLTIKCGAAVTFNFQPAIMYVRDTLNVCNGSLHVNGLGANGGSGGSKGGGNPPPAVGQPGAAGSGGTGGGAGGSGAASSIGTSGAGGPSGKYNYCQPSVYVNPGGPGVTLSAPVAGGGGGGGGTLARKFNHIFEYLIEPSRATATGGGGGGGGSSVGGGNGGPGGGYPGSGGSSTGGAGGKGGGVLVLLAKNIIVGASGSILASGATGSNGSAGNGGNGGAGSGFPSHTPGGGGGGGAAAGAAGGGGGGGGVLLINYKTLTNNGSIAAPGGAGGAGATTGGTGGAGGPSSWPTQNRGFAGSPASPIPSANSGSTGNAGTVLKNKLT